MKELENRIFSIQSSADFEQAALETFQYQASHSQVYGKYLELLKCDLSKVKRTEDIPFLPIGFFKTHSIRAFDGKPEIEFLSSGTTGMSQSKHEVFSKAVYERSFKTAFRQFYGDTKDLTILALLPNYLEREGSSLIYMVDDLIRSSTSSYSGFYLNNTQDLIERLNGLELNRVPTLLIGVSYALLDLIEQHPLELKHTTVMETGGMKGRRKEMVKAELHQTLSEGFGVTHIHSEYGMTELLSQAYSKKNQLFYAPPWMKVLVRDPNDPFQIMPQGQSGGMNIIDLANLYSCSFIASQDLGRTYADGGFEVLGRFDNSDIRGCNLLVQ